MLETIIKLILRASLTAGIAAAAVMLIRLPLKKAPKRWSYLLWAVVFFRCLCPLSVESAVSIFNAVPEKNIPEVQTPDTYEYIPVDYDPVYVDYSGNADFNKSEIREEAAPQNTGSVYNILFIIWVSGAAVMLLYAVISYVRLMMKMKTAIKTEEGIYETDMVSTAFSAGLFPPKIFLPCGLSEKERELIIAHERVHIRRLDFLTKPLAFAGLALHWFNPMVWISFALMTKDMELSCDEAVLKILGAAEKKSYSEALLKVSVKRSGLTALPLAFAGTGIKERVKNVLSYKKSGIIATVIAAAVVLTAGAVLGTDAVRNADEDENNTYNSLSVMFEGENTKITDSRGNSVFFLQGKEYPYLYYSFGDKNDNIDPSNAVKLGNTDFYEYDKPCLVPVSIFKSGDETKYLWDETALEIDFDASKVERFIVNDARLSDIDGQTTIKANVEFQFAGEYQWNSPDKFNNKSVTGWYMAGSSPNGGCEIEFELPVPTSDKDTYSEFLGYGILLCGFDDAEIGYGFSQAAVHADSDGFITTRSEQPELELDEEGKLIPESSFEFLFKKYMNKENYSIEFLSGTEIKIIFDEDLDKYAYYHVIDVLDIMERNIYPDYELKFIIETPSDDTFKVDQDASNWEKIEEERMRLEEEKRIEEERARQQAKGITLKYPIEDPLNTCLNGIEPYGSRKYPDGTEDFHKGIDFSAPEGTPVYAAADGKIINYTDKENGYGICIIIDHGSDLMTLYAHLSEAIVQNDDEVKAGDLIGYVGSTGNVYGATLHFEVRVAEGQFTDPMDFLAKID